MGAHEQSSTRLEASMGATLDALAWELELAGDKCVQLDTAIGRTMASLPAEHRGLLIDGLHTIDLLSQHLSNLTAFARAISEDAPSTILAPVGRAVGGITLGALSERMAMTFGVEDPSQFADVVESGEVEFF